MSSNPLDSAWKLAKEFHAYRNAPPAEIDYFNATGFRNALDEGMARWFNRRIDDILKGSSEVSVLRWVGYASIMGYPTLGSILLKVYHLPR